LCGGSEIADTVSIPLRGAAVYARDGLDDQKRHATRVRGAWPLMEG